MRFCGFCGKGPFPSSSTLNKHIRHSVNCNKAEHQEWGIYATNIWDNAPGHSDNPHQPLEPPQILDNEELASLPDTTLKDDLQGQADLSETALDPDIPDIPDIPRHEPENNTSTVNDHEDEGLDSATYIQEFPTDMGAGAVWGEEIPFFEKLRREQVLNQSSRWGPFEDQDEWELAQWLIRNTGQNQTNALLNLKIVTSHLFIFLEVTDCVVLKDARTSQAFVSQQPGFSKED